MRETNFSIFPFFFKNLLGTMFIMKKNEYDVNYLNLKTFQSDRGGAVTYDGFLVGIIVNHEREGQLCSNVPVIQNVGSVYSWISETIKSVTNRKLFASTRLIFPKIEDLEIEEISDADKNPILTVVLQFPERSTEKRQK